MSLLTRCTDPHADQEPSKENDAYNTSSPYSASKAGSDHLVTHGRKHMDCLL